MNQETQDWKDAREAMSLLMDGRLSGEAFDRAVCLYAEATDAREMWFSSHLVGDVLRSAELAHARPPEAFLARLRDRLATERESMSPSVAPRKGLTSAPLREPANDSLVRWKMFAAVASLAAVTSVIWSVAGRSSPGGAQLAANPTTVGPQQELVVVASPQGNLVRDARLQEMLAAHKQFGGAPGLQTPAGFLRNATFEAPAR